MVPLLDFKEECVLPFPFLAGMQALWLELEKPFCMSRRKLHVKDDRATRQEEPDIVESPYSPWPFV